jgi:hypothetical protein
MAEIMEDDQQLHFLYTSISDMQSTIRAVDTKVGFLLVLLIIPINSVGKIYDALHSLYKGYDGAPWKVGFYCYICLCSLAWLGAFFSAFKVLTSIRNPSEHIKSPPENGGRFYRPGLFPFSFLHIFLSRPRVETTRSVKDLADSLPQSVDELSEELVFEQMKLAYIRDIKTFRQNWAYTFGLLWLFLAFVGAIAYLVVTRT